MIATPTLLHAICGYSNILDMVLSRGGKELDRVGALCGCRRRYYWRVFRERDSGYRKRLRPAYCEFFNRRTT